jgi:hypothetical protein
VVVEDVVLDLVGQQEVELAVGALVGRLVGHGSIVVTVRARR